MNTNAEDSQKESAEPVGQEMPEGAESAGAQSSENAAAGYETEIANLKAQVAEANDKFLRLYSEFDNFKRRTTKERLDLIKSDGVEVITEILPVLDDLERAVKSNETATEVDVVKEGVALIYSKFKSTLQQKGLKEIESLGTPFDTDLHDALTSIPAPSEDQKGKVIDEVQKGYYLQDKVIRHAKVVIAQ